MNGPKDRVVAVGLLTQHDLDVLGTNFTRHFAVPTDDTFADLLSQLDEIEIQPIEDGLILRVADGNAGHEEES